MIPVENNKFLFRDENSNAIINCSDIDYENYLRMKNLKLKEIEKSNQLENDIKNLKKDINEIKSLLEQVINKWVSINIFRT